MFDFLNLVDGDTMRSIFTALSTLIAGGSLKLNYDNKAKMEVAYKKEYDKNLIVNTMIEFKNFYSNNVEELKRCKEEKKTVKDWVDITRINRDAATSLKDDAYKMVKERLQMKEDKEIKELIRQMDEMRKKLIEARDKIKKSRDFNGREIVSDIIVSQQDIDDFEKFQSGINNFIKQILPPPKS